MEYEDLEFDEEKYYLGTLCKRGHDWNGTGCSLRFVNNNHDCVKCVAARSMERRRELGISKRQSGIKYICLLCDYCFIAFETTSWDRRVKKKAKGEKIYCSNYCGSRSIRPRIRTVCANCGKTIFVIQSQHSRFNYCCMPCKHEHYKGKLTTVYKHGESGTRQYRRKIRIKNRRWREVIEWVQTLPEEEKSIWMHLIDLDVKEKMLIVDLHKESSNGRIRI